MHISQSAVPMSIWMIQPQNIPSCHHFSSWDLSSTFPTRGLLFLEPLQCPCNKEINQAGLKVHKANDNELTLTCTSIPIENSAIFFECSVFPMGSYNLGFSGLFQCMPSSCSSHSRTSTSGFLMESWSVSAVISCNSETPVPCEREVIISFPQV